MNIDPNPLADLLNRARQALADPAGMLPVANPATPEAGCVVFFATGEGGSRARVASGRGADVEAAWQAAAEAIAVQAARGENPPQRLRAEVVDKVTPMRWRELKAKLAQTKRNYFNEGIAFDARFEIALLAQEMHGGAVLYNAFLCKSFVAENVPSGISEADHVMGMESTLKGLANLLE